MRVAYVHDWLVTYRGGEKVLEALLSLYPEAPIHTLFYDPSAMPASIRSRQVIAPAALKPFTRVRKALLPILPHVVEALPLEHYDLVISTSSCVAKGIVPGPTARHLCYLHSPMRYVWDQRDHYLESLPRVPGLRALIHAASKGLRQWDTASSQRVDRFVVNSRFIGERVERYYRRDSQVIHPPVAVERFSAGLEGRREKGGYLIVAGAFVAYKRFDLAIEACERLGRRLIVAGSGPEEARLRRLAGKHTEFVIRPNDDEWLRLLRGADALLFPALEDFGIIAIEAMAAGTPVIAYAGGGALDFIRPGQTGEFFAAQTSEALADVIEKFVPAAYDQRHLIEFARGFNTASFLEKIRAELATLTPRR